MRPFLVAIALCVLGCVGGSCNSGCNGGCNDPCPQACPGESLIAFSVASKLKFEPKMVARVPFEVIMVNEGGHFKADNAFHAPCRGFYSFTFSGVADVHKWADMYLYTQKSGGAKVGVARGIDRGYGGSYGTASGSVIIMLEAEETVSVWIQASSTNDHILRGSGIPTTLFSGKLEKKLV